MKYKPELGIMGNLKELFSCHNKNQNQIYNNKVQADNDINELIDGLMEVAELSCDDADASTELAEMIVDLYDAVAELGELISEKE